MRLRLMLVLTTALLLGLAPRPVLAVGGLAGSGDPFTLFFDENGNGQIDNRDGTGLHPLPGVLIIPTGGSVGVLTFMLPTPVVTGDVRIWEDTLGGTLSDVLRFTNANGNLTGALNGDRLQVFSDVPEPGEKGDLADIGLPALADLVPRDNGGLVEVGTEGNNGVVYSPGGALDNIYHFTSDAIPEPSSIIMLSIGAFGAAGYGWRRRKAGAA
jgi:hypothetical protein